MTIDKSNQPGGIAAENLNLNPNPPSKNQQFQENVEALVTLKHAAAAFNCAASSLKNNIKAKKLVANQDGPKSAYMVRLSDVECFLRDTPGITSTFHSKSEKYPSDAPSYVEPVVNEDAVAPAMPATKLSPGENSSPPSQSGLFPQPAPPSLQSSSVEIGSKPTVGGNKRRRSRRGKGGIPLAASHKQKLVFKALMGLTPQERLRVVACLNELAGMIAST